MTANRPRGPVRKSLTDHRPCMQTYLPYDLPYAVRRFLRAFQPVLGITVETEAWPNLVAIATQQRVPMALVNGRLSERSYRRSLRYASLMRETAERFSLALAQTQSDAERIRLVGAKDVEVTGNLKFDFAPDEAQVVRGKACGAAGRSTRCFCIRAM